MSPNSPLRSSVFRLAMVFAALYSLAIVITGAAVFYLATSELEHRMRLGIVAEQTRFKAVFDRAGLSGLVEDIQRYGDSIVAAEAAYLLLDPEGKPVAGNISPLPAFEGWQVLPDEEVRFNSPQSDDPDWFYLHGIRIADHTLISGRSNEDVEEPQEIVLEGISWGVLATLVLGLGGALYIGRRAQARIDNIQHTLQRASGGDLKARIQATGQNDDIERISTSINDAIQQLEGLVEGMKQISTDIAHDLKTPIGRLRQKLETARSNAGSIADYEHTVDEAIEEVDAIVATFEALLRIAQIGGGARKARFKKTNLKKVIETIEEVYAPVAEEAGDRLTASLQCDDNDTVNGDHELLVQMFANIVENAIRHCPMGSAIHISLLRAGQRLVTSVSDNGPGIPGADREKVFRRFYRIEKSRTTPGNGLGLALVSAIAELHDADLSLHDTKPGLRVEVSFKVI